MQMYKIFNKEYRLVHKAIEASSPKDAFFQYINYKEDDDLHGLVIEECSIHTDAHFYVTGLDDLSNKPITAYKLRRPSMESFILRNKLAHNIIEPPYVLNPECVLIKTTSEYVLYVPDHIQNLTLNKINENGFAHEIGDLHDVQNSAIKTLRVVGGRTVQDCSTFFQGLEIDCLDLTEFYAPSSVSWARAFELSRINTIKGLQNQSFANVRDMDRAFYKSKITKVDLHGQDFRKVNKLSNCFGYSVIGVLNLHDVKLKDLYDMSYMFQDATILSGLDLSRFTPPDKQLWCARMFKGLVSPYLDISTWVKHKYCIYTSMFVGCKLERLKTKDKSPFVRQYKKEVKDE